MIGKKRNESGIIDQYEKQSELNAALATSGDNLAEAKAAIGDSGIMSRRTAAAAALIFAVMAVALLVLVEQVLWGSDSSMVGWVVAGSAFCGLTAAGLAGYATYQTRDTNKKIEEAQQRLQMEQEIDSGKPLGVQKAQHRALGHAKGMMSDMTLRSVINQANNDLPKDLRFTKEELGINDRESMRRQEAKAIILEQINPVFCSIIRRVQDNIQYNHAQLQYLPSYKECLGKIQNIRDNMPSGSPVDDLNRAHAEQMELWALCNMDRKQLEQKRVEQRKEKNDLHNAIRKAMEEDGHGMISISGNLINSGQTVTGVPVHQQQGNGAPFPSPSAPPAWSPVGAGENPFPAPQGSSPLPPQQGNGAYPSPHQPVVGGALQHAAQQSPIYGPQTSPELQYFLHIKERLQLVDNNQQQQHDVLTKIFYENPPLFSQFFRGNFCRVVAPGQDALHDMGMAVLQQYEQQFGISSAHNAPSHFPVPAAVGSVPTANISSFPAHHPLGVGGVTLNSFPAGSSINVPPLHAGAPPPSHTYLGFPSSW